MEGKLNDVVEWQRKFKRRVARGFLSKRENYGM